MTTETSQPKSHVAGGLNYFKPQESSQSLLGDVDLARPPSSSKHID